MTRFVTVKKLSELTGFSEMAIRHKTRRGIWREGLVWRRGADGRILIDLTGYENWCMGQELTPVERTKSA